MQWQKENIYTNYFYTLDSENNASIITNISHSKVKITKVEEQNRISYGD